MLIISTSESTCCVLLYVDSVVGHEPEDCMGHFCVIKHYIELFEPVFSFLGFWVKFLEESLITMSSVKLTLLLLIT